MTTPLVTIVIPNHNYARYLRDAVDSALAQTFVDREVLVIDNGSTDDSHEVLKSYGDRIRWIAQDNRGQSAARNRGIEESRGAFIAFLDADDAWLPAKLERQMMLFENRPQVGVVYCAFMAADSSLNPLDPVLPMYTGDVLERFALEAGAVVRGGESTAVIRKECFERVGVFDPELSICGGWDMYRRIACCYAIDAAADPLVLYRVHGANASLRADVYEHDVLRRLAKMFTDPLAERIYRHRRRSYGKSYLAIAGTHLHAGDWWKALGYAVRSLLIWPPSLRYIAQWRTRGRSSEHELASARDRAA